MSDIPYVKLGRANAPRNNYRSNNYRSNYTRPERVNVREQVPEIYRQLVSILHYNADIRRYTSFGVINHLRSTGVVEKDEKVYVKFLWNKFTVRVDNRNLDYAYTSDFFITSLIAAFNSFASINLNTIGNFISETSKKGIDEITNQDEVNKVSQVIVAMASNPEENLEESEGDEQESK